jgi:type I restriction enzyme, S subunit
MNGTGVGTIGRVAPYLHTSPAIPDNHVTILRPKPGLDAVYLSVFLNSMAGRWQVEERLRGSSGQIELYPTDIAQFTVWIAPAPVQKEIRRAVEKSFEQKQRATQLLDAAKRAVEIAIEESEATALKYLEAFK